MAGFKCEIYGSNGKLCRHPLARRSYCVCNSRLSALLAFCSSNSLLSILRLPVVFASLMPNTVLQFSVCTDFDSVLDKWDVSSVEFMDEMVSIDETSCPCRNFASKVALTRTFTDFPALRLFFFIESFTEQKSSVAKGFKIGTSARLSLCLGSLVRRKHSMGTWHHGMFLW